MGCSETGLQKLQVHQLRLKVGDPVVLLTVLEVKPAGIVYPAGTVAALKVIEHGDDYYEVEFDEDQLFIVKRDQFRPATPEEAGEDWIDPEPKTTDDGIPF